MKITMFILALCFIIPDITYGMERHITGEPLGFILSPADTTISVKVKGITCATDLATIKANVENLKGISACHFGEEGATTTFEIKYDPKHLTAIDIIDAIEGTGGCENPDDRPYKVKRKKAKKKK